jgi:hypothetical protein
MITGENMSDTNFNTYFVVENVNTASNVIDALRQHDVADDNIGVVSKDSEIALAELPEMDVSEKSKLPEALTRGALLGSGSGLLAGVLLAAFPVAGITLGGAAIASMTAGGAAVGAWSASMVGISESSPLVEEFHESLDKEHTLIFCSISAQIYEQIQQQFDTNKVAGILKYGRI